jgi:hypothetical protein
MSYATTPQLDRQRLPLALRVPLVVFGLIFVGTGATWLAAPAFAASKMGMALLEPEGRSTQIGDLASFFLTLGTCILVGSVRGHRQWFHPAILLLALAAAGRTAAWLSHGAGPPVMAAVEVVVVLLLLAGLQAPQHSASENPPQ